MEAKHTYSLSYFTNTAPTASFPGFPEVKGHVHIRKKHSTMSFSHRQAYMIEVCYLCLNKACFQQRVEIDFCKVKCFLILSGTKFSIESLLKVLYVKYALLSS